MECAGQKDEEIVKLVLQEPDFFGCLIDRYEKRLFRYIKRVALLGKEDVEDVLQNVFLKVYSNLNDFDTSLSFSSWIYRIAHNESISLLRKNKNAPVIINGEEDDNFFDNIASDMDVREDLENADTSRAIRDTLQTMDQKYREILILRYLEQKDYNEISDILKISSGTVATHIHRAKTVLKKKLLATNNIHHDN